MRKRMRSFLDDNTRVRKKEDNATAKVKKVKHMTEHEEQVALFKVMKLHEKQYPGLELAYAIPNGGHRHPAVAAKLKAEGVKAGVPDLFIPVPRGNAHGLYVELKAKGGTVSDAQRTMMAVLSKQGYACIVAYGWESAWGEIEAYMKSEIIQLGVFI